MLFSFFIVIAVLWSLKIVYERNKTALYLLKDEPVQYEELKREF